MIFTAIPHSIGAIHRSVCHGYNPRSLCTIFGTTGFLNALRNKLSSLEDVATAVAILFVFVRRRYEALSRLFRHRLQNKNSDTQTADPVPNEDLQ